MFTDEEIKAAKRTRDAIISGDVSELKSVYMAGEIVMWDEIRTKNLQQADLDDCFINFIRVNNLSKQWDEWCKEWHNTK